MILIISYLWISMLNKVQIGYKNRFFPAFILAEIRAFHGYLHK